MGAKGCVDISPEIINMFAANGEAYEIFRNAMALALPTAAALPC
jgi:hypothetical protein